MNIGLIAHDSKKTLMQNFCIAYRGILSKHNLYATGTTGRLIEEVTNLNIHKYLAGPLGGKQQLGAQIAQNDIDALIFLREPNDPKPHEPDVNDVIRLCDMYNIPLATNIATAESLVLCLDRGDVLRASRILHLLWARVSSAAAEQRPYMAPAPGADAAQRAFPHFPAAPRRRLRTGKQGLRGLRPERVRCSREHTFRL